MCTGLVKWYWLFVLAVAETSTIPGPRGTWEWLVFSNYASHGFMNIIIVVLCTAYENYYF